VPWNRVRGRERATNERGVKVIYDGIGNKLTCDLCGFGDLAVEVKKLVPPNPPPRVIRTGCYHRDKAALDQRVSAGRYSVRFIF
jgi:hypothetical protein